MHNKKIAFRTARGRRPFGIILKDILLSVVMNRGPKARCRNRKLLYVAIKLFVNEKGEAWPSLKTLQKVTSLDRHSLLVAKDELVEAGVLIQDVQYDAEDGRRKSNHYILIEDLEVWDEEDADIRSDMVERVRAGIDVREYSDEDLDREIEIMLEERERRKKAKEAKKEAPVLNPNQEQDADAPMTPTPEQTLATDNIPSETGNRQEESAESGEEIDVEKLKSEYSEAEVEAVMAVRADFLAREKNTKIEGREWTAAKLRKRLKTLSTDDMAYVIRRLREIPPRTNATMYILTLLVKAPEQRELEEKTNMAQKTKTAQSKTNRFNNFPQRNNDWDAIVHAALRADMARAAKKKQEENKE